MKLDGTHRPSGRPGADPWKGPRSRFTLRTPGWLMRNVEQQARKAGMNTNDYIVRKLEAAVVEADDKGRNNAL